MLHSHSQPPGGVTALDAEGFLLFPDPLVAIALSALRLLAQDNAAPQQVSPIVAILNNPLTLVIGLFLLFYFIVILPERRRKSDEAKLLSSLKKNDRVVTIGGIHGTVVAAPKEGGVVTIRIDENSNTRVKINRSAIARILSEPENEGAKSKETAADANGKS